MAGDIRARRAPPLHVGLWTGTHQRCCCQPLQGVQAEESTTRRMLLSRGLQEVTDALASLSQQADVSQQTVPAAKPAASGSAALQQQQAASDAAMRELLVRVPLPPA